jgi:aryl-alcohol dehydrogenase-like predicted oxidoreductase
MEYRQLGRTNLKISSIGLGAVTFSREIDEATAFTIIDHALDRGINLIDTAEAYNKGGSETVVGSWIKQSGKRNQVVLATKLIPPLTAERIPQAVEASLRRLQTDVIDLYQIHAFDKNTPLDESLEALGKLVTAGKVRYLGCSNFAAWQLCKALWRADLHGWPRLESIQPNYNLAIRDIEQEILPLCADQQIGVISYSPLGAGFLSGKYSKSWSAPAGTRFDIIPDHWAIYEKPTSMARMEKLRAKADETGRSMVQLALAWVLGQPGITTTLVGSRNTDQIDQAFEAAEAGLSTELRAELNSW